MAKESTHPERTFRVGLRAQGGIYFPQYFTGGDDPLTVGFPSEVGPITIVFRENRRLAEGFTHPIRLGHWIDVSGPAPSMNKAVEILNVAGGRSAILCRAANGFMENPTAEVAMETTFEKESREYWSQETKGYDWPHGFGRGINPRLVIELMKAYFYHSDSDRLHRAIVQYQLVLQNWVPGSEIAALFLIWIGMEAMTNIVRKQLESTLNMDSQKLARHYLPDEPERCTGGIDLNN